MSFSKYLVVLITAMALVSCGGGGGSAGTSSTGTNAEISAGNVTLSVASFVYQLDKNSLSNSGTDKALLTITALDASNNPVSGAAVSVAADTGIYTPTSIVTNASGVTSGSITIGGNKSNRNIKATVTINGKSTVITVPVTGSQIGLTALPAMPMPGGAMAVAVKVTDVNGSGVANTSVTLSGTLGFTQVLTTDANGNAQAQLGAAPVTSGIYSIEATGSGVVASRDIQVINAGGGGIPAAVGTISAPSLAISPNTIAPNTAGSTTNRAELRAVFLNASNQPIQNVRVRFDIISPQLDPGESISTGTTAVYSDVSGVAVADYIAGSRSSPTNGVIVRACYGSTDADIAAGACPNFKTATMTIASQPLSITLGDNNKLEKGANELTYIKKFDVAVADSAGNAVANARISASVDLKVFEKGSFLGPRVFCMNEDTNRNGTLDMGEDIDGNGSISPRKADIILSFVGSATTGSNGRATIQVEYPQNVATWLQYAVTVTTNVAGSEGTVEKYYVTDFVKGDEINGSFLNPPYGRNACSVPN
jgi:Bacterial Ig-like domain (group 1)